MKFDIMWPQSKCLLQRILACIFVSFLFLECHSQSLGQNATEGIRKYHFNILYISLFGSSSGDTAKPLNVKFFADEEPIHLSSQDGEMSSYFNHTGASILYFYHENGTNKEGDIIYKPVFNVNLGSSGQKLIIVIPKPDGTLVSRVFDMGEDTFPSNSAQLLNFSQQTVLAKLGDKVGSVASSKSRNIPISLERRRDVINFALAVNIDGKAEIVEMKRVAFTQNGRRLILVYNDPRDPEKVRHRIYHIARPLNVKNRSDDELEKENLDQYMQGEYRTEGVEEE
tara:strand:- start:330 stop:1178 length:849 start_codon:yes stop_codon:yes gene_type:complete